jgi:hypothetical protein
VVPVLVVVEGYLALTSSRNDGTGFVVPVLPCLISLSVVAGLGVPWRSARLGFATALSLVAAFNVVMKADVFAFASQFRVVDVPVFGTATLTNGQGYLHQHLVSAAGYRLGPPTRWLPDHDKAWLQFYDDVAAYVDDLQRPNIRVRLALVAPLLNASALRLAAYRGDYSATDLGYVDTQGQDSVSAYRRFLVEQQPVVLLTTSREAAHFGAPITQRLVEAAATSLGYKLEKRIRMPDGRELRVWTCRHATEDVKACAAERSR